MHEMGIANSVLEAVRAERLRFPASHISKVGVRIGELAGVDPDALSSVSKPSCAARNSSRSRSKSNIVLAGTNAGPADSVCRVAEDSACPGMRRDGV